MKYPRCSADGYSSTTVLKYVPQADLALLDPGFTPALVTRNHAYLVYAAVWRR